VKRALVVDDDRNVHDIVRMYLDREGFEVTAADDGLAALESLSRSVPDLVILDVMMPGIDGFEVCRRIRRLHDVPIIFLTCRDEDVDTIIGLEVGADDYITKPFNPRELVARVKAVLRRAQPAPALEARHLSAGDIEIELASRDVAVDAQTVKLTPKEFDVLVLLASHPRIVFSRDQIMENVWGYSFEGCDVRTVDTHVKRLRKKLTEAGAQRCTIEAVWGTGYRLVTSEG